MVKSFIKTNISTAAVNVGPEHEGTDRYIAAVDVGTSSIRCFIFDQQTKIRGTARRKIELIYPKTGWVEIDPENLWQSCVEVLKDSIQSARLSPQQIDCIGISTQRATFLNWNKKTGKPFHNFITWQDLRAEGLVKSWNHSRTMRLLRVGAKVMHWLTGKKRFLAASVLTFSSRQVVIRLLWVLDNIPGLRESINKNEVAFGMIETWLLWKLTGGQVHASDYSNISATAMFDPFQLQWGEWILNILKIPTTILPEIKDTSGVFGYCEATLLGARIPITSLVADQQAAMFGECCFQLGDVKCTLGSGSFLDVNTGSKPHASLNGVYPLIGWKFGSEITYIAEGASNDTGTAINWLESVGLLDDVTESSNIAWSVDDSGGVYFIPAFSGLQAPINDNSACAGFLGISTTTQKTHLVRAVLESLVYRLKQLFDVTEAETNFVLRDLRVDGGVSNCDFVMQLLADVTQQKVNRPQNPETTSLGTAFLAGLGIGIWKSKEEFIKFRTISTEFYPFQTDLSLFRGWERAVQRCTRWYK
uniref:Glycerol kinase 5 n=1 Tax=Strigamia maritima TaxID=126957 RepID=T1IVH2_STRMM